LKAASVAQTAPQSAAATAARSFGADAGAKKSPWNDASPLLEGAVPRAAHADKLNMKRVRILRINKNRSASQLQEAH
jgi:hypothetical protein